MKTKIVNLKVKIEVGEDFDLSSLALCKYVDDHGEVFLPKDDDFKVSEYLEIAEIKEE